MEINDLVDDLSGLSVWQVADVELLPMLQELEVLQRVIAAVAADLAAEAETRSVHVRHGCRTLAVLLRDSLVLTPFEARRRARLAHELPSLPHTREALREGAIQADHVFVVSDTLAKLPAERREEVEKALARHARTLNSKELDKAGKHLRALVDPDGVYEEEREAIARRYLKTYRDSNGMIGFRGLLDTEAGEAFLAAMHSLATPRVEDEPKCEQRYADALTELVRTAMASEKLPTSGGERPQVSVTIPYTALDTGIGTGWASWGGPMSAPLLRKVACDAQIIPIVLGGDGVPLDVGRSRRTAPPGIRRALVARDKGCAFPGCDRPPAWTEAHHVVHWINGGATSLANMVLLCSHHHHVVHHGEWEIRFDKGMPVFIPPAWVDPDRAPRSNIRLGVG